MTGALKKIIKQIKGIGISKDRGCCWHREVKEGIAEKLTIEQKSEKTKEEALGASLGSTAGRKQTAQRP